MKLKQKTSKFSQRDLIAMPDYYEELAKHLTGSRIFYFAEGVGTITPSEYSDTHTNDVSLVVDFGRRRGEKRLNLEDLRHTSQFYVEVESGGQLEDLLLATKEQSKKLERAHRINIRAREPLSRTIQQIEKSLSPYLHDSRVKSGLQDVKNYFWAMFEKDSRESYREARSLHESLLPFADVNVTQFAKRSSVVASVRKKGFHALSIPLGLYGISVSGSFDKDGQAACITSVCAAMLDIEDHKEANTLIRRVHENAPGDRTFSARVLIRLLKKHASYALHPGEVEFLKRKFGISGDEPEGRERVKVMPSDSLRISIRLELL